MGGLETFANGLADAVDQGTGETAGQVKQVRDQLVHVDTGELKASGRIVRVDSGHWEVREGDGLPDARAIYEEYGTSKHPPHPHMTPAAERNRKNLPANVARHLKALERKSRV
jgi:hypothetical protein